MATRSYSLWAKAILATLALLQVLDIAESHATEAADGTEGRVVVSPDGMSGLVPNRIVHADSFGRVVSVSDASIDALGATGPHLSAEAVARAVKENAPTWNVAEVGGGDLGDAIELSHSSIGLLPDGRQYEIAYFEQSMDGIRAWDGSVVAVAVGGRLLRITGRLYSSVTYELPPIPKIGPDDAVIAAEESLLAAGNVVIESDVYGGYEMSSQRLLYRVTSAVQDPNSTDYQDSVSVVVDAVSGEIVDTVPDSQEFGSVAGSYRVYAPAPGDATDTVQNVADATGAHVSVNASGTQYYPWRDTLANRTPTPIYDDAYQWSGGSCVGGSPCIGFNWNAFSGTYAFVNNPGGSAFRLNHLSYWTQRAVDLADQDMAAYPPPNGYRFAKITTVIANDPNLDTRTSGNGCLWTNEQTPSDHTNTWRPSDSAVDANPRNICIRITADVAGYGGNAARIATIFHELGHATDRKYHDGNSRNQGYTADPDPVACDIDTEDEGSSLAEAVAAAFSAVNYLSIFGDAAAFNGATATGHLERHMGGATLSGHTDDDNLVCHAPSGSDCSERYTYTHGFVQAFWEIAKGLNCDGPVGEPCYVIPDGARAVAARKALIYAISTSPVGTTYQIFKDNVLEYYYLFVSYDAWASRWWVFDHHGLSHQNYAYHPCSSD